MITFKNIGVFILALNLFLVTGSVYAQISKQSVSNRIANMSRLLNESSAAKQVIGSDNRPALLKRKEALAFFDKAVAALEAGAETEANGLLSLSAKLMFEAIKLATPVAMLEKNKIINYGQRKQTVIALKEAFNRISDENNETQTRDLVNKQLDQLIDGADQLLGEGRNAQARLEIDKAYHLLKVTIESIRAGQTLVRSLQFETKKEEYIYEIDRNDTHSMLISLLVDEKEKTDRMQAKINSYLGEASQLREQAEAYANEGAFEQAIELLEQSTRQIVRAIRSAGVYIPG